jgi:hypothetical protein
MEVARDTVSHQRDQQILKKKESANVGADLGRQSGSSPARFDNILFQQQVHLRLELL